MKASELRASILQEAVSGRLVPQNPSEGTAEDLLKEIAKERESLVKAGMIKKEKPLPEITGDEIPFDIPKTWKWVRLGDISIINPRNQIDDSLSVSFIPMPLINEGYTNKHSSETRIWKEVKKGFTHIKNGDLGIAKITPCFQNRKSVIFRNLTNGYGAGTTELHVLRFFSDLIYPQYVLWFVKCQYFISRGMNNFTGTAGQERVGTEILAKTLIPLPPLSEQKRIVAKVEELMCLINAYGKEEEKLSLISSKFPENIHKSILQEAVSGRLVPQNPSEGTAEDLLKEIAKERETLVKAGKIKKEKALPEITEDEIPFEIPKTWKWVRLGDISIINPRNQIDDSLSVSFIPMPLINEGYTNKHSSETRIWKEVKKGFTHIKNGDLGIAKITPCFQNRKSVIFRNLTNEYGAGTTELHVLRFFSDLIYSQYVLWFVKCQYFISRGMNNFTGTAGQERVGTEILAKTLIPLPPLSEQKRIVAKIEELMNIVDKI